MKSSFLLGLIAVSGILIIVFFQRTLEPKIGLERVSSVEESSRAFDQRSAPEAKSQAIRKSQEVTAGGSDRWVVPATAPATPTERLPVQLESPREPQKRVQMEDPMRIAQAVAERQEREVQFLSATLNLGEYEVNQVRQIISEYDRHFAETVISQQDPIRALSLAAEMDLELKKILGSVNFQKFKDYRSNEMELLKKKIFRK